MSQLPFGTSSGASSRRQQEMDENLLKMDIDAAEKHMKEHFGDHANWSHERLLKLFYRKSNSKNHRLSSNSDKSKNSSPPVT